MLPRGPARFDARVRSPLLLLAPLAVALLVGCPGDDGPRLRDGGAFTLPDGGFVDASVRDTGVDAGPFQCDPACPSNQACGCILDTCGCFPRGGNLDPCDIQNPDTCGAGTTCTRARVQGRDVFLCSDGRDGNPCSKTQQTCTTELGCVCLTPSNGQTDCQCVETWVPQAGLCDRMVPETCPGGTCVRATTSGGTAFFICSDGSEGQPCEVGDNSCRTSLGCTCPRVSGRDRCACSEPAGEGEPCDFSVPGSCEAPLMCVPRQGLGGQVSTVCGSEVPDAGTMTPGCDPNNPGSCPPGFTCTEVPGMGFQCVPG